MRCLRWIGLMSGLLLVGVLGELLAPLPSHALSVMIDGRTVGLTPTSAACTSGYNLCAFIPSGTYGRLTVGDVSSTNKARIMIGDNSAASSLDLLKLTGITFTPVGVAPGSTTMTTAPVVVTHWYNAGGGNPAGDYAWGYGVAGYLDPPSTENIVGDQLKQSGQGNFAGKIAALGLGVDTGVLATPSTLNLNGSVTKSSAATVVMPACDTGSARCAPTITQTFTLTFKGADKLVLSDSVIAAGGTCRSVDQVIPIPPYLYALMLQLDPTAPNDINQLSPWLARMGQKYLDNNKAKAALAYLIGELNKWLAKTVPGTCPQILEVLNAVIADDVAAELVAAAAAGAVPAAPGGTITITKTTPGVAFGSFTFNIDGPSASPQTISMGGQSSQSIVVPVEAGTYNITENPLPGWSLIGSYCGMGYPTTGVVVAAGSNVSCTFNNGPVAAGNGTIVIVAQQRITYPAVQAGVTYTFGFTGAGQGIANFSLTPDAIMRTDSKTFSGLVTGAAGGTRTITETDFSTLSLPPPYPPSGYWWVPNVPCVSQLGSAWMSTTNNYGLENTPVGVTVTNLADGDTLTCIFSQVDYAYFP